jgi:hypothetical protein
VNLSDCHLHRAYGPGSPVWDDQAQIDQADRWSLTLLDGADFCWSPFYVLRAVPDSRALARAATARALFRFGLAPRPLRAAPTVGPRDRHRQLRAPGTAGGAWQVLTCPHTGPPAWVAVPEALVISP